MSNFFRKCFGPKMQQMLDLFSVIVPQIDFLKDMILVVRLISLLGGIAVFTNSHLFSSNVGKFNKRQSYKFSLEFLNFR